MKDIKFRGKPHGGNGRWEYSHSIIQYGSGMAFVKDRFAPSKIINGTNYFEVVFVGQYIGRKDKNSVEIYDGDIFKLAPSENGTVVNKYIVRVSDHLTVEIRNIELEERFFPFSPMRDDWWEDFQDEIEVIGNIYDNPELIK